MNLKELEKQTVGKIVAKHPQLAIVFEKYEIDYCCRGKNDLVNACQDAGVELNQLLNEFEQVFQQADEHDSTDWTAAQLTDLITHIVETHHRYMRDELPRLAQIIAKVKQAHSAKHPELVDVENIYSAMRGELESHMAKEENVLFPAIRAMELAENAISFPFGSVDNPIRMMEHEHEDAGNALRSMRQLTNEYTPPQDACPTFHVMLQSMSQLERDLHMHIHKENNILFPRAHQLEQAVAAT